MALRKVLFKKWIPIEYRKAENCLKVQVEGTGYFEPEFSNAGLFHQWANAYEESSEGFGNYTIALVETPDGTIEEVLPKNLKFINSSN
jgi:hypothetical protein